MGISTLYFLFVQMLPPTKEEILVELPHVKLNTKFVKKKKKKIILSLVTNLSKVKTIS